ncbi:hypothetical protein BIW11_04554 [Tropilaelaps mercedesae]|uniref:HMG box domain-containing protein n=1 Tax=Tropilaelaps mercedesae TaxID=418985 RepID=A0A1V9X4N3_9ACAR|nr:hypothetical protein BIW11_04554 [Tropilaelaps mercedesae]
MPKKVAPFWVFYKKFESDLRQKGQKLGREEMHAEASRYWEQMNADDRAWFVEK